METWNLQTEIEARLHHELASASIEAWKYKFQLFGKLLQTEQSTDRPSNQRTDMRVYIYTSNGIDED